jgi:hypothetical protein
MWICYLRVKATLRFAPALRGLDAVLLRARAKLTFAFGRKSINSISVALPRNILDMPRSCALLELVSLPLHHPPYPSVVRFYNLGAESYFCASP